MKQIVEIVCEITEVFERLAIPYALIGGLAVRLYGIPRATFDVDFTIVLDRNEIPRLSTEFVSLGYAVPATLRTGWIDSVRGMGVISVAWPQADETIEVDIFLAETRFQNELIRRRVRNVTDGFSAWFVTAEDLVLLKLLAGRRKDIVDIGDIFLIQGSMDRDYLHRWAREMQLETELKSLENEFGIA